MTARGRKVDPRAALRLVIGQPHSDWIAEVVELFDVTSRTAANWLASFELCGFVTIDRMEGDRRRKTVSLTAEGQKATRPQKGFTLGGANTPDKAFRAFRRRPRANQNWYAELGVTFMGKGRRPIFRGEAKELWLTGHLGWCKDCSKEDGNGIEIHRHVQVGPVCVRCCRPLGRAFPWPAEPDPPPRVDPCGLCGTKLYVDENGHTLRHECTHPVMVRLRKDCETWFGTRG